LGIIVTEPELLPDEQILWQRAIERKLGPWPWSKKEVTQIQMVTNKAVRLSHAHGHEALDLSKIHRIEITDRHSRSEGTFRGYSMGARGSGVRTSWGSGEGRSRSYGDLVFFHDEFAVFTLQDVEDPTGVRNLIRASNPHIK
jgi:hypothetical protein